MGATPTRSNHIRTRFLAARGAARRVRVALPSDKKALVSKFLIAAFIVTQPIVVHLPQTVVASPDVAQKSISAKSAAQVESLVLPHVVIPNSCELKLKGTKATSDKRPSPLSIRVSESQKEIIRRKAQAAGIPVGRYIVAVALGPDYTPPADPELVRALLALNRELTAQGNNVNQIAKHLNGGKASLTEGEGMVGMIGRSILRTLKAVRAALAHGKEPAP
jgi:hypothetical protein